jgi:phage virion morphogenesis protein
MTQAKGIHVDREQVIVALQGFRANLQEREDLLRAMGMWMLGSIRRTFRDQGVPSGSWPALSPSTVKSNPRKYGSGHKLLIDTGRLLNSISFAVDSSGVRIGTNLVYAAVHQYGSRDRGAGIGPQARIPGRDVAVRGSEYQRMHSKLPIARVQIVDKNGNRRGVNMRQIGPRNASRVRVRAHSRFQNIPARPYVVFRPNDRQQLQSLASAFMRKSASAAGLDAE